MEIIIRASIPSLIGNGKGLIHVGQLSHSSTLSMIAVEIPLEYYETNFSGGEGWFVGTPLHFLIARCFFLFFFAFSRLRVIGLLGIYHAMSQINSIV